MELSMNTYNLLIRVRLFWVKMISENHFPPNPHVWLQRKMKFSGNSFPVDQYLLIWPGNNFTLLFSVQIISEEREREREERAQIGEREREEEERAGDRRGARLFDEREERAGDRPTSALIDRDCRSRRSLDDRTDLASDLAFTSRSHLLLRCAISIWPDLMNFFAGFCFFCEWVWNWFIICMFTVEEVCGKLGM